MLGHLPSGFWRKNRVTVINASNRHDVERIETHTQQNVRRRRKPRFPLLDAIPGWKASHRGLSPICPAVGVDPASHPISQPAKKWLPEHSTGETPYRPEHNHLSAFQLTFKSTIGAGKKWKTSSMLFLQPLNRVHECFPFTRIYMHFYVQCIHFLHASLNKSHYLTF